MSTTHISKPETAKSGRDKIDWVRSYMSILNAIEKEFRETKPFDGDLGGGGTPLKGDFLPLQTSLTSPNFPAQQPPWRIVFTLSVAWLAVAMQGSFCVFGGVDFLALCGYRTRFMDALALCCRTGENTEKTAFFACVC